MVHKDERGTVSAVGLAVLTVILLLGLAVAAFMRNGADVAVEYEREMQLRLAAESAVETAAAKLERDANVYGDLPDAGETKEVNKDVGVIPTAEKIELHVFIETPRERGPFLTVGAAAIDESETRVPDGEKWLRAKIVRARMEKKGDHYVWRRWY